MRIHRTLKFIAVSLVLTITGNACKTDVKTESVDAVSEKIQEITLEKLTVNSEGHPMAVWVKKIPDAKGIILFVHGRTWSSVPDFDLQVAGEEKSLMDGMNAEGYTTYAVDLRGYGETPRDKSEWMTPVKAAKDVVNVLNWIAKKEAKKVHLFGWSMGATVSLLATQTNDTNIKSLTLFGFWMDLDMKFPEDPADKPLDKTVNTAQAAASDFITPGSISQQAIDAYVAAALKADPIRVDWRDMVEFKRIDPALIELPVLILQGEYDPIAPAERQSKLFNRLKTSNKSWSVISGGDHAAFMESPREDFIRVFNDFISRF